jgi:hypothetical protein
MLLHGGWNPRVEDNIIVDGADEQILISNMQPDKCPAIQKSPATGLPGSMSNSTFVRNVFSFSRPHAALYRGASWLDQAASFRRNLVHHPGFAPKIQLQSYGSTSGDSAVSWEQWQARGQDAGSLVADPRFFDAAHGGYRLRPDSPAVALKFAPTPTEQAGLYEDRQRASWPVDPRSGP